MISPASFSRHFFSKPNFLSILRGVLGMSLPFLILHHRPVLHVLGFLIFVFGAVTDYWDGLLARRHNLVSDFGKIADPTMDKVLILAPLAAFSVLGFYSPWWIVPIFFREILVTFCRIGWLLEGDAIGAERLGKLKFVFQVGAVGAAFFYLLSYDYRALRALASAFHILMFLCLVLALILTLVSGAAFFRTNRGLLKKKSFARFTSAMGVGLLPYVPGTWGSLFGLGLVLLVFWNPLLYLAVFAFLFAVGYWAVEQLDLSREKDPMFVVIDEACGIFVTFFMIPLSAASLFAGFFLFRLFDIIKPYPIRSFEKLPRFWGIMCDDLGAGFYAWVILYIVFG